MPEQKLTWYQLILINIYYLGLTSLAQTLTPLVLPLLIQEFVGEGQQGTYYGNLRLWTLMVALLVQSLMGLASDRSTLKWGKRRPFILAGSIVNMLLVIAIGVSASLSGQQGYWVLFGLAILIMVATNTSQGALQGFIPDLVPPTQRGLASGVKALFEIPLPLILVAFTIAPFIARGHLWTALLVLIGIILISVSLAMFVHEPQPDQNSKPINWQPFFRLVVMTGVFTGIILVFGLAIKLITGFIGTNQGLRNAIVLLGIAGFAAIAAAIGLGVLISIRIGLGQHTTSQNSGFSWWVVNRLAFLAGSVNIASFAVFYIQSRLGYTQEQAAGPASLLLLIVGVLILVTAIPSGWIADRVGYKNVLMLSGITAAMGVVIILLANTLTPVFFGSVLIGISTGTFYTTNWALGTAIVPPAEAGRFLGIANLAGAGAGAVGAFIGGPLADFFTSTYPDHQGIGYVVLFAIFGILFLLSTIALKFINSPVK
jgi:MFS family permease